MKRIVILIIFCLAFSFTILANDYKPPVVKNYAEVLKKIEYPMVCRVNGIEGTVLLEILVDEQGNLESYRFLNTICTDLNEAVDAVVDDLTFSSATLNNSMVKGKVIIPITFSLSL